MPWGLSSSWPDVWPAVNYINMGCLRELGFVDDRTTLGKNLSSSLIVLKCTPSHLKGSLFETDFLDRQGCLHQGEWVTVPLEAHLNYMCANIMSRPGLMARTGPSARSHNMMPDMFLFAYHYRWFLSNKLWVKPLLLSVQLTSKQCEDVQWMWVEHTDREGPFSLSNTPCPSLVLLAFLSSLTLHFPCLLRKTSGDFFVLTNGYQAGHSCHAEFVVS